MFRYFERIKRPLTSRSDGSSNDPNVVQSEINMGESSEKKAQVELNEDEIVVDRAL